MIKEVKISALKVAKNNPRYIRDTNFAKLVESIKTFPEMLHKRPLVVDEDMTVIGGNMRLKACQELGMEKVPVIIAKGWSQAQKDEFMIKDNLESGQWDWDKLANEFEVPSLLDWGMDSYNFGADTDSVFDGVNDDVEVPTDMTIEVPKITDNGYTRFEIVIPEEHKKEIIEILNSVKVDNDSTQAEAFLYIFKNYKND